MAMSEFDDIRDRVDELEERAELTATDTHTSEDGLFLLNEAGEIIALSTGDGWNYDVADEDFERDANGDIIIADFTGT
jgi:hypothetical protein